MNRKFAVQEYRQRLELTQKEMAEKIGCSTTSYNHKELGKKSFTDIEMIKILELAKTVNENVTIMDLFF